MPHYKAIEVDPVTRRRTGREHVLDAASRDAAIVALLRLLGLSRDAALVDPSRTLLQVDGQRWTLVAVPSDAPASAEPGGVRRAGAKHKRVR